jgi:prepilin-type N-terminal cleavage/methylation domain-containing protein
MEKRKEIANHFGFTFIEVLAAVVIVGILSLVSFMVFQGKRDSARATAAYLEMRQLAAAETEVEANYDYLVPLAVLNDVPGPSGDYAAVNPDCIGNGGFSSNYWLIDPDTGYSANDIAVYFRKAKSISSQLPANIGLFPTDEKARKWQGPFITFQRTTTQSNGDRTPIDPWGNEYYLFTQHYQINYDGSQGSYSITTLDRFAIVSIGKDNLPNTNDDLIYTFK